MLSGTIGIGNFEAKLSSELGIGNVSESTERIALLSALYNSPALIGNGMKAALNIDAPTSRAEAWFQLKYFHKDYTNSLQYRRSEEADELLNLISNQPIGSSERIEEIKYALDFLFNGTTSGGVIVDVYSTIQQRDSKAPFEVSIASELDILIDKYAPGAIIDFIQRDKDGTSSLLVSKAADGKTAFTTNNMIFGEDQNDTIIASSGNDVLVGGEGSDSLSGGNGHDTLLGGAGADTLEGGDGSDVLDGGKGNDTLYSGQGGDTLTGGADQDTFIIKADTSYTTITDFTSAKSDIVSNDKIDISAFSHQIQENSDLYVNYDVILTDGSKVAQVYVRDGETYETHLIINLQGIELDELTLDDFIGLDPSISLTSNGNDEIINNDGDATILINTVGNDSITGGDGEQVFEFSYSNGTKVITDFNLNEDRIDLSNLDLDIDAYTDLIITDTDEGALISFDFDAEQSILLHDIEASELNASHFLGDASTYPGGLGSLGDDYIQVSASGTNGVRFETYAGDDTVYATAYDDTITGGSGDNLLFGNAGSDYIGASAGTDTVYGGSGADVIDGGDGDNYLYGDAGNDTLTGGSTATGGDELPDSGSSGGSVGGSAGGSSGSGGGNITYVEQFDYLSGGEGTDTFSINNRNNSKTTIEDFELTEQIDLTLHNSFVYDFDGLTMTQLDTEVSVTTEAGTVVEIQSEVVISLEDNQEVILKDTTIDELSESNFIFGNQIIPTTLILGTDNSDLLQGDSNNNFIYGNAGDDTIDGVGGSYNELLGGEGNDLLYSNIGVATLRGENGNDTLVAGEGYSVLDDGTVIGKLDYLNGGNGTDTFRIIQNADALTRIDDFENNEIIDLTSFDGTLNSFSDLTLIASEIYIGSIEIDLGNSQSIVILNVDASTLNASHFFFAPEVNSITGTDSNDVLAGTDSNDIATVGAGDDAVDLGTGNDEVIVAGAELDANDTLAGGEGIDTLTIIGSTIEGSDFDNITSFEEIVFENDHIHHVTLTDAFVASSDTGSVLVDFSAAVSPENGAFLDASAVVSGTVYAIGGAGADLLVSGALDDTLIGGAGNDVLNSVGGNDQLTGGSGSDRFIIQEQSDRNITITDFEVGDQIDLSLFSSVTSLDDLTITNDVNNKTISLNNNQTLTLVNAAALVLTADDFILNDTVDPSPGDDFVEGTGEAESFVGGGGDDTIHGKAGNDTITGDAGADSLRGGQDNDLIDGGADNDFINGNIGNDTVGGGEGDDTLKGGQNDDLLYGGEGNDSMKGNKDHDVLYGEGGTDALHGNAGNDTLYGGADNDSLYGGQNDDLLYGGDGDDLLRGNKENDQLFGEAGNDDLNGNAGNDYVDGGAGDDFVRGGQDNDTLIGGLGNDDLRGNKGNDQLTGGLGVDELRGGQDNDVFVWTSVAESGVGDGNRDVVVDFGKGDNQIDLTALNLTTLITAGNGTTDFTGTAGEVVYDIVDNTTILSVDVDGDTVTDLEIELTGTFNLTNQDILI